MVEQFYLAHLNEVRQNSGLAKFGKNAKAYASAFNRAVHFMPDRWRQYRIDNEFNKSPFTEGTYARPDFEKIGRLACKMASRRPDYAVETLNALRLNYGDEYSAYEAIKQISVRLWQGENEDQKAQVAGILLELKSKGQPKDAKGISDAIARILREAPMSRFEKIMNPVIDFVWGVDKGMIIPQKVYDACDKLFISPKTRAEKVNV